MLRVGCGLAEAADPCALFLLLHSRGLVVVVVMMTMMTMMTMMMAMLMLRWSLATPSNHGDIN